MSSYKNLETNSHERQRFLLDAKRQDDINKAINYVAQAKLAAREAKAQTSLAAAQDEAVNLSAQPAVEAPQNMSQTPVIEQPVAPSVLPKV